MDDEPQRDMHAPEMRAPEMRAPEMRAPDGRAHAALRSAHGHSISPRDRVDDERGSVALRRKRMLFWLSALLILSLDVATKYLAHSEMREHARRPVLGEWLRLTLLYNPGAAFGLSLGPYSRWLFTALTIVALVILAALYRSAARTDRPRVLALGLVIGGALGNLVNRLWSVRGVVDWIDVGIGEHRWPSFNVADIGVSIGAVLLAITFWREDRAKARESSHGGAR
jgi:signal peptidase II